MNDSQRNAAMGGGTVWGGGNRNDGGSGSGRTPRGGRFARRNYGGRGYGGRGGRPLSVGHGRRQYGYGRGRSQGRGVPAGQGPPSPYAQYGGSGRAQPPGRTPGRVNGRGGRGRGMPMGRSPPSPYPYTQYGGAGRGQPGFRGRGVPGRTPGRVNGRGGRGRGMPMGQSPPSKFDVFNRYVGSKIITCLTREDQEILGKAYPRLAPTPLTEQQKMMMAKKKMFDSAKKEFNSHKEDNIQPTPIIETKETKPEVVVDETDKTIGKDASVGKCELDCYKSKTINSDQNEDKTEDESEDEVCLLSIDADKTIPDADPDCACEICATAKDKKECNCEVCRTNRVKAIQTCDCDRCRALRDRLNRVFNLSGQDCNCKKCRANKLDPEKKAEMMKVREENLRINHTDCDTLLAQLNTKRLYRRIKYYKREDKQYNVDKAYPYKKSTVEIAEMEWGELLEDYKTRRTDLFPDYVKHNSWADNENDGDSDHEYEYVGDKPSKYELLMFTPCPRAVAVLASYPRSGNSLLRNLYEKITLRVTGSDMMGGLQKHDLVGEMATGTNNVQFVKTHYPERMGAPAFLVSRAVLLVRNPYDALDSYFNLMSTNSHTKSVTKEERKKHAHIFADMARKEILVWRDFHEFWLKQKIPLLVIRYEDLIRYTAKVIGKVVKFVLEVNSMTFFEDRIQCAIGEDQIETLGAYKARSGGIGKSLTNGNYSAQLLNEINYGIIGTMEKFGYKEMLVPKPSDWRLKPLDQLGVFIPGSGDKTMVLNNKGLVRGPKRQTNWQAVKKEMMPEASKESAKKVSLF